MDNERQILLPASVYGKDLISSGGVPRAYAWLSRHHKFPDQAIAIADAWIQSFQWRYGGGHLHPPVAVCIPVEDGALLLRFTDAGKDDQGRPHGLRLEAAWADAAVSLEYLRPRFLVQTTTNTPWLDERSNEAKLDSAVQVPEVLSKMLVKVSLSHTILAAREFRSFSLSCGQDVRLTTLDAHTWEPVALGTAAVTSGLPEVSVSTWHAQQKSTTEFRRNNRVTGKRRRYLLWLSLLIGILLTSFANAGYVFSLQRELSGIEKTAQRLRMELIEASMRAEQAEVQLQEAKSDWAEEKAQQAQHVEQLQNQIQSRDQTIEALRRDAEQGTRDQVEHLEQENRELETKHKQLLDTLKAIHQEIEEVLPWQN